MRGFVCRADCRMQAEMGGNIQLGVLVPTPGRMVLIGGVVRSKEVWKMDWKGCWIGKKKKKNEKKKKNKWKKKEHVEKKKRNRGELGWRLIN